MENCTDFKQSKTYQNLINASNGEMKASTRYAIFGAKAREDGYEQIGNIYDETSHNEKEHAEVFLKILNDGEIPDTADNLKTSMNGENEEWTSMYPEYAKTAHQEGYHHIAELFEKVAEIERHHDFRFEQLLDNINTNQVFCKNKASVWICLNCGNIYVGTCAPKKCPFCGYPQAFYELNCENY